VRLESDEEEGVNGGILARAQRFRGRDLVRLQMIMLALSPLDKQNGGVSYGEQVRGSRVGLFAFPRKRRRTTSSPTTTSATAPARHDP
jgi:hypothetical protein